MADLPEDFLADTMQEGRRAVVDGLISENYDLGALERANANHASKAARDAGKKAISFQRLIPPNALNE